MPRGRPPIEEITSALHRELLTPGRVDLSLRDLGNLVAEANRSPERFPGFMERELVVY